MSDENLPATEPELFPNPSPDPVSSDPAQSSPASLSLSLFETLQKQMAEGQTTFQKEVAAAGGAAKWLRGRCPRSASLATGMSDSAAALDLAVLSETASFWRGVEVRLAECQRCTPEGGACEKIAYRHDPGKVVHLAIVAGQATVTEAPCGIYTDFKIAERLEHCGVPRRLSRTKLTSIATPVAPHIARAFDAFVARGKDRLAPLRFSLLLEGPRAREYGAALLRSAVVNFQNADIRSVDARSLIRDSKEAMTVKRVSPVSALADVDVLLLDDVDASLLKSDYGSKELRWLYTRRHDRELATLLTCTSPGLVKEAFPGVSVLRV